MGLTIGYKLSARRPLTLAGVLKLIEPLRGVACDLGFETVGELIRVRQMLVRLLNLQI